MSSFKHKVTVPKVDPRGRDPRFWAIQDLAIKVGDCIFEEEVGTRVETATDITFFFWGDSRKVVEPLWVPKKEKPKKPAKKKMTLLERLKK